MKISRENIIGMYGAFEALSRKKSSVKFHYLTLKNKRILLPEVEAIQETQRSHAASIPDEHQEFETKRLQICEDYSEKDEDGNAKTKDKNFVILEDKQEEFNKALLDLKEEYKSLFNTIEKQKEDFSNLLKEEVEIELIKIPMSIMPDEVDGSEIEVLFDLIEEDK